MVADTTTVDVPEQGQLVEIRRRRYVVTDVVGSTHPTSPLSGDGKPQHLLSLASVEDDALGEELQVIWELEPGARVYDAMALPAPAGFDEPRGNLLIADDVGLERAIQDELTEPEYVQLLFSRPEHEQHTCKVTALEARLAQIPGETEQEAARICARYTNPRPRLFPAAVTFLVPERSV
jgi:hypothetical protein